MGHAQGAAGAQANAASQPLPPFLQQQLQQQMQQATGAAGQHQAAPRFQDVEAVDSSGGDRGSIAAEDSADSGWETASEDAEHDTKAAITAEAKGKGSDEGQQGKDGQRPGARQPADTKQPAAQKATEVSVRDFTSVFHEVASEVNQHLLSLPGEEKGVCSQWF